MTDKNQAAIPILEDQQRLIDLVRFARHELFNVDLISWEEYATLLQVRGSVDRLEDYDRRHPKAAAPDPNAPLATPPHRCVNPVEDFWKILPEELRSSSGGAAIGECLLLPSGELWVKCYAYASQVNYCPFCGAKAPVSVPTAPPKTGEDEPPWDVKP